MIIIIIDYYYYRLLLLLLLLLIIIIIIILLEYLSYLADHGTSVDDSSSVLPPLLPLPHDINNINNININNNHHQNNNNNNNNNNSVAGVDFGFSLADASPPIGIKSISNNGGGGLGNFGVSGSGSVGIIGSAGVSEYIWIYKLIFINNIYTHLFVGSFLFRFYL